VAVLEFVMILMAIIVGLGIAEILRCSSRILLGVVVPGRVHTVWMATVFLQLIEVVVAAWGFRDRADWTFLQILALLAPTAVLYVAATVLNGVPNGADADEFFMERRRPFLGLLAAMITIFSIQGWNLIFGWLQFGWGPNLFRIGQLALLGVLAVTSSRRFHHLGAIAYLLVLIWFVVLYSPSLSNVLTPLPGM